MWSFTLATQLKSQTPQLAEMIKGEPMLQHWLTEALSLYSTHPRISEERLARILALLPLASSNGPVVRLLWSMTSSGDYAPLLQSLAKVCRKKVTEDVK